MARLATHKRKFAGNKYFHCEGCSVKIGFSEQWSHREDTDCTWPRPKVEDYDELVRLFRGNN